MNEEEVLKLAAEYGAMPTYRGDEMCRRDAQACKIMKVEWRKR